MGTVINEIDNCDLLIKVASATWWNRRSPTHIPTQQQEFGNHPQTKVPLWMYGIQAGDCETLVEPKTKETKENAGLCPGGPVLATDPSGLCDNPIHLHNPPRHPGRVTSTYAYRPQPQLWTLKWYLTLLQPLLAAGPNCPGTQTETCPSVPLRQVHWLCSDWILEQLHNPTPPLKAMVQKQSCQPGTSRETCSSVPLRQAYQHWSDCGSWSGPVTQYKPLSAAARGQSSLPRNLVGDSQVCASEGRPTDHHQLQILK